MQSGKNEKMYYINNIYIYIGRYIHICMCIKQYYKHKNKTKSGLELQLWLL